MIRSLPALLLLASAGLAGAQTLTLDPVAARGLTRQYAPETTAWTLGAELSAYDHAGPNSNGPGTVFGQGRWAAEFDISRVPAGNRIISATFKATVTSNTLVSGQNQRLGVYYADGTIAASDITTNGSKPLAATGTGERNVDVTQDLKNVVGAGGRYLGFKIGVNGVSRGDETAKTVWTNPTLVIRYDSRTTFTSLGSLEKKGFFTSARALSADGLTVVGVSDSFTGDRAFVWTAARGIIDIGTGAKIATGVSGDGGVVVGSSNPSGAFRWVRNGAGTYFGANAIAGGIASGGTVVGSSLAPNGERQVYRWSSTSTSRFPTYVGTRTVPAHAVAASADGTIFVGAAMTPTSRAFVWNSTGGQFALPILPGGTGQSEALGVSADGKAVVGWSRGARGPEAFRWTAAGMVGLGNLRNPNGTLGNASRANAISPDGKIVVGVGVSGGENRAFIWEAATGMQNLQTLLLSYGLSFELQGWTLFDATGVTTLADGTIVVTGTGYDAEGRTQAFHAKIPSTTPPPASSAPGRSRTIQP